MRTRKAIPLVVLALGACSHQGKPRHPGDEYLKKVGFEGNKQLSDKSLLTGLVLHRTLKAGRPPDPYTVQTDGDRVKSQYHREGYFEADVQSRVEREKNADTVTYTIVEGARSHTEVTIHGLPPDPDVDPARVRAKLPLKDGAPFDYDVYDTAKVQMLGVVQDAGYAHAKLDARVEGDIAAHVAHVVLAFDPGPKCRFGKIEVTGVDGKLRDAVVARLHFKTGDPYSNAAITSTQRALYGLQRFSTVQVGPEPGDTDVVDMKVAVSESNAHQVTLGGGFEADPISFEVRGRAGYEVTGWPGKLDRVVVDLRPAYAYLRDGSGYEPRIRALARLEHQDLFLTYAVGSVEVGYNYLAYEAFTEYGPRAQLGYDLRLGTRHLKLHGGYLIHQFGFRKPSMLVDGDLQKQIGIDHDERVGAVEGSLIADFRDHPIEPRYGVYGELKVTEGSRYAGGDYDFTQLVPELRGYVPVGPVVVAARARYGAFLGGGQVPPTERFYAGGATSNRGFAERQLSPSVSGDVSGIGTVNVPYGGAGMIDSSLEARFPITTIKSMPLGGLAFLDGGDVTETASELNVTDLCWAVGAGMRLLTIVGPARFDIGYRLNRTGAMDPEPGHHIAFHLSLGEAF